MSPQTVTGREADTMTALELAGELVRRLAAGGWKAATAESCTGGMAAQYITAVSGASEVFDFGVVSYANRIKERELGVAAETLAAHGAVSGETAHEMAAGILARADSDLGLATTGIAGPTGGTLLKPVGTVHIAACFRLSGGVTRCLHERLSLLEECGNDRAAIREETVRRLFLLALRAVEELEHDTANQ